MFFPPTQIVGLIYAGMKYFLYLCPRMKECFKMTKITCLALLGLLSMAAASCGDKPKSDNIIVRKQSAAPRKHPTQEMSPYEQKRNIEWLGATYKVCIERKADRSLPLTQDEQGNKYYDNRITVRILRGDGSVFYDRTFTKADFSAYVSSINSKGALLGVVFDRADGETLRFAASVGSPDRMSDEYDPLVVGVSRTGGTTISKDQKLDTTSDEEEDEEE